MDNTSPTEPRESTPATEPPAAPIAPTGSHTPQPTPGTEDIPAVKKWLPRLVIGTILINVIPSVFGIFGESYRETGETIRNYANILFIIGFFIIIVKQVTERK